MDNDIIERAKEYAPEPLNDHYTISAFIASEEKRQAYIAGATEQKAIDDERAKNAFDRACGWLSIFPWYNAVFEEFMKNMESDYE